MKITDTHIYFWTGYLSNFHPCKVNDKVSELEFKSSEQAYMWYKADHFNDATTKKLIENATSPKEAKQFGRLVSNYNDAEWTKYRYGYMVHVVQLKFSQNDELKKLLLETNDKVLVEASPYDKIWGVGLGENDPLILDERNWHGLNLLGHALMFVRTSIKNIEINGINSVEINSVIGKRPNNWI